jgi:thiosulfate/3-mercaptopyruvate sulfurtransferase
VAGYAHPDSLVSTAWVAEHLDDPSVCIIQVEIDPDACAGGHVPGAVCWRVWGDLLLPDERVNDDPAAVRQLLARSGVRPEATIVLYGDAWNWGASLACWLLASFGHARVSMMNGGRQKWIDEGRPLATAVPTITPTDYPARTPDWSARARRDDVLAAIDSGSATILDVRLREEYRGELFRPSGPPQDGQRAGHIPGAVHVPWETAVNEDGTFKDLGALRAAYAAHGITPDRTIIPYCTIGGRSGHTWYVLSRLLGYPRVQLYDASWKEWGEKPSLPIG